jgi:fluoride ion exporter CrcB/FEX
VVTDCSLGNHDWLHWRLTTYSSFNYETSRLLEEGAVGAAALNAGVTIIGAFIAGGLGLLCAKQLLGQ